MKHGLKCASCPALERSFFPGVLRPADLLPQAVPCGATNAFSLIELLVIVTLILVLTTLYWGSHAENREHQREAACQKNLLKIFMALDLYANEHTGKFPATTGARTAEEALDVLIPRYTSDTSVFICPGSKNEPLGANEAFRNWRISYSYYMGRQATNTSEALMSDAQVDTQAKSAGQLVFSNTGKPPGNNHAKDGGNFLMADGHAEASRERAPFALGLPPGVVLLNPKP
jgi:prepilin-type processing-associated H-X9-DG protein